VHSISCRCVAPIDLLISNLLKMHVAQQSSLSSNVFEMYRFVSHVRLFGCGFSLINRLGATTRSHSASEAEYGIGFVKAHVLLCESRRLVNTGGAGHRRVNPLIQQEDPT